MKVDDSGVAQQSSHLKTQDEKVSLDVSEGTKLLDSQGEALASLSASEVTSPPAPPAKNAIVSAYDFGPDGATFEPAITLTMNYTPDTLPEGVNESELYIACWDGSQWQTLDSTVDTTTHTVTAKVSHFSQFAVMGTSAIPEVEEAESAATTSLPDDNGTNTMDAKEAGVEALASPSTFDLSKLSFLSITAKVGEKVTISVTVTNAGGQSGSYDLTLKIDDDIFDTTRVTLAAGASKEVNFTVVKDTAGTYAVDINGKAGTFVIKDKSSWWNTFTGNISGWWSNISGNIAQLLSRAGNSISEWWEDRTGK